MRFLSSSPLLSPSSSSHVEHPPQSPPSRNLPFISRSANDSPDLAARTLPVSAAASSAAAATSRAPRRQNSNSTRADEPPSPVQYAQMEYQEEFEPMLDGEDEQDKTLYCFCQRVSFGEMIACDAPDCEHEWVRCFSSHSLSLFRLELTLFVFHSSIFRVLASRASRTAGGSATRVGYVLLSPLRLLWKPSHPLETDPSSSFTAHPQGGEEGASVVVEVQVAESAVPLLFICCKRLSPSFTTRRPLRAAGAGRRRWR